MLPNRKKILVVDDSYVCRTIMVKILVNYGECHSALNGEEALEAYKHSVLEHQPFDLITLDIGLPDIGGPEVLEKIRTYEEKTKVLMVTSHSDKDSVLTCIRAGCDVYIVKPIQGQLLLDKLRKMKFPLSIF